MGSFDASPPKQELRKQLHLRSFEIPSKSNYFAHLKLKNVPLPSSASSCGTHCGCGLIFTWGEGREVPSRHGGGLERDQGGMVVGWRSGEVEAW